MVRKPTGQTTVFKNRVAFTGARLDAENRWVKIAGLVPWDMVEAKYSVGFENPNKAPFDASTMTWFRKRLSPELIEEVNEYISGSCKKADNDRPDNPGESGGSGGEPENRGHSDSGRNMRAVGHPVSHGCIATERRT